MDETKNDLSNERRVSPLVQSLEPERLDAVVEANRALLHQRSQLGIKKYGKTLQEGNYSERALIIHALEEALDLANYLQAQLMRHDREELEKLAKIPKGSRN